MPRDDPASNNPVFETVPVEDTGPPSSGEFAPPESSPPPESLVPETVPEDVTAADVVVGPPPASEGGGRRYLLVGLGVVIFVAIFVFVLRFFLGSRQSASPKDVVLTYWGLWEDAQVFVPLIQAYQGQHPNVKINYTKMDPQDYREKLIQRSRNGQGPDIFRYHNTWVPQIKEVLSPLPKEVMSKDEFEKTFYPVAQEDLGIDDFYYGIPLEIDGLVLVYNDILFKRAGIETAPVSWEDVVDAATRLTVKDQEGQIFTSGIALGTATNIEHFSDILGWMFLQNGADLKNLGAQEAADALEEYRTFAEPPNNLWDPQLPNSVVAFIQEEVAMIIVPSWQILTIKQQNPDLALKVTTLPTVPGGREVALASYWVEGVNKTSKNQTEAWKFLKFLVEKENLTKLYEEESKVRLFGEPYSRVDLASTLVQNEYIGPVVAQAKYTKSLPVVSRTYDGGLNDEIIKYLEDAVNATVAGVSYGEALATAQRGVAQVFEKYGIE